MDYKKAYEEALKRFKHFKETYCTYGEMNFGDVLFDKTGKAQEELDSIFPELAENEDEKTRKELVNFILYKVGHLLDEETEHRFVAYLEKQKEQKPVEPSIDELQRREDEFYNFKIFAAKQATEHHISFVHNFEWNNFCAELLSYFNEKQKPVDTTEIAHCINCPVYEKAEWSEEDEEIIGRLRSVVNKLACYTNSLDVNGDYCEGDYAKLDDWLHNRLKSLRPQPKVEWSKEDQKMLRDVYESLYAYQCDLRGDESPDTELLDQVEKEKQWVKSLPERLNLQLKEE